MMIKAIIISLVVGIGMGIAIDHYLMTKDEPEKKPIIKLGELKYNTIDAMPQTEEEEIREIYAYNTAIPKLDIKHIKDNKYNIEAELYKRKFSREVEISIPEKKNIVIANLTYSYIIANGFYPGCEVLYYRRLWPNIAFGGGIEIGQRIISGKIGGMYVF